MSDTRERQERRVAALARIGFGEPFVTSADFGGVVLASCNVCGAAVRVTESRSIEDQPAIKHWQWHNPAGMVPP